MSNCTDAQLWPVKLRLLATTDMHVHLLGYDYYADRETEGVGLAKLAGLIAEARQEVPGSLLLDNGDFLQGNPMGDYVMQAGGLEQSGQHPAILAMNQLGYDAATLGNHEFNYGLDTLERALKGANFPVVSANVARKLGPEPARDQLLLSPWVILNRDVPDGAGGSRPLRVGIIGFAPPQVVMWDRLLLEGRIFTRGIVEAARVLVPQIRAAGADLVVALSHSGLGPPEDDAFAEHASAALATVPGIDAIVAGHSHLTFPHPSHPSFPGMDAERGTIFGVPVVQPGYYGSHLGVIDLDLEPRPEGGWRVTAARAHLRASADSSVLPSPAIARAVATDHAATIAYARRPVGFTRIPLHSYFSTVAPCTALRVVAQAQAAFVRRQLAGRPEAALPVLSAASPFKAGGRGGPFNYTDVPVGDVKLRNVADLYIFPNTIAAIRVTGAELREWLENSMGLFNRIQPGVQDQPLLNPAFPSYNHDRILGISFSVDLSQPARYDSHGHLVDPGASRVRDLSHDGRPLDPAAEFVLATNSYRVTGCGGYLAAGPDRLIDVGRTPIRDILLRHIAESPPLERLSLRAFEILPMPGTSVIYDTSPAAEAYLDEISHLQPEPLGLTETGFARFRLHL